VAQRYPWYSFLYRAFGAQGTFWLWLFAPLAMWWTFEAAVIRLENRRAHSLPIHEIRTQPRTRWVEMSGVRLSVDRRLLQQTEPPGLSPVALLIEEGEPAARWWSETHAWTGPASGLAPCGGQGGLSGLLPSVARKHLIRRFAKLRGSPSRYLPGPERTILLLDQSAAPLSSPPAEEVGVSVDSFVTETDLQIARVRDRVDPDASLHGVVTTTPAVLTERVEREFDLPVPEYCLQVDREPRELESVVFGVATIVFIFLAAGLYGTKGIPQTTQM
jgi:hypothetical protein